LLLVLDGGRIGLSGLKKFESLLRTAGDEGSCESVSIVLSDKESRGFRGIVSSSMEAAGDAGFCSFLGVLLSAGLKTCSCCSELERSKGLRKLLSWLLSPCVCAFNGEHITVPMKEPLLPVDDSLSRDGVPRNRGIVIEFGLVNESRDGEERTLSAALGTGSRERLVAVFGDSIFRVSNRLAIDHAFLDPGRKFLDVEIRKYRILMPLQNDRFQFSH
jgi:hypothetical protein